MKIIELINLSKLKTRLWRRQKDVKMATRKRMGQASKLPCHWSDRLSDSTALDRSMMNRTVQTTTLNRSGPFPL